MADALLQVCAVTSNDDDGDRDAGEQLISATVRNRSGAVAAGPQRMLQLALTSGADVQQPRPRATRRPRPQCRPRGPPALHDGVGLRSASALAHSAMRQHRPRLPVDERQRA